MRSTPPRREGRDNLIDREPASRADVVAKRRMLLRQCRELRDAGAWRIRVTCPCGARIAVPVAYQCRMCGFWFCGTCANRHFAAIEQEAGT